MLYMIWRMKNLDSIQSTMHSIFNYYKGKDM